MQPLLNRIKLYVKNVQAICDFYERYFGVFSQHFSDEWIAETEVCEWWATLMAHPAAKSVKTDQVAVKLVFDVDGFKDRCLTQNVLSKIALLLKHS